MFNSHSLSRRSRKLVTGGAAVVCAAAIAVPAVAEAASLSTRIVPFSTVAGFKVDTSLKAVEARLGKPSFTSKYHGKVDTLFYDNQGLIFTDLKSDGVTSHSIQATKSRYHTPNGLHVGSTEAALKKKYHVSDCSKVGCSVNDPHNQNLSMTVIFNKQHVVNGIALYDEG